MPYQPSFIDRFYDWLDKLPLRAWVFYLVFVLVLLVLQVFILWLENGLQDTAIIPVIVFNSFATPFLLALMQLLDQQALTALTSMRPVLDLASPEFDRYAYRISTMRSNHMLAAGAFLLLFAVVMEQAWIEPVRYAVLDDLPLFNVVFNLIDKSSAFLYGVFFYHTLRQLRLVNDINTNHTRVNLFNIGPLQAFSRLTATTAVGLVLGVYGWVLINPELLSDPLTISFAVVLTVMAVLVFVWPLYGVHRRMVVAKDKALHEIDLHFEAVFAKFNRRLQADDYTEIERLNLTISALEIQRSRISAIPTWPWKPETAQFALTAIAIPLVLALLQFIARQVFGL